MTPNEQRIAIAEAVGWKHIGVNGWNQLTGNTPGGSAFNFPRELPDFCSDLNAMHEAEKTLNEDQYMRFEEIVYDLVAETDPMAPVPTIGGANILMPTRYIRAVSASAAQRCEAFLKTIGKWKE